MASAREGENREGDVKSGLRGRHGQEQPRASRRRFEGLRYIDEFLECKCAPDLLDLELYPNAKEVTESFSLFNAVRRHLTDFSARDEGVVCIVVGDGSTPRTGAMLAYRTRWKVHSVDPQMRTLKKYSEVRNLTCYRSPIENVTIPVRPGAKVLVLCMHTHVTLECCLYSIRCTSGGESPASNGNAGAEKGPDRPERPRVGVVACPCCQFVKVQSELFGKRPDLSYEDKNLLSQKRTIHLWKDVGEPMQKCFSNSSWVESLWIRERVARYPKNWLKRHQHKLGRQIKQGIDWRQCMRDRLKGSKINSQGPKGFRKGIHRKEEREEYANRYLVRSSGLFAILIGALYLIGHKSVKY